MLSGRSAAIGLFCCGKRALFRHPQLRQFEILEADPADAVVLELCGRPGLVFRSLSELCGRPGLVFRSLSELCGRPGLVLRG